MDSVTEDSEPFSPVTHQERHPVNFNQERTLTCRKPSSVSRGTGWWDAEVRAITGNSNYILTQRQGGAGGGRSTQT